MNIFITFTKFIAITRVLKRGSIALLGQSLYSEENPDQAFLRDEFLVSAWEFPLRGELTFISSFSFSYHCKFISIISRIFPPLALLTCFLAMQFSFLFCHCLLLTCCHFVPFAVVINLCAFVCTGIQDIMSDIVLWHL